MSSVSVVRIGMLRRHKSYRRKLHAGVELCMFYKLQTYRYFIHNGRANVAPLENYWSVELPLTG